MKNILELSHLNVAQEKSLVNLLTPQQVYQLTHGEMSFDIQSLNTLFLMRDGSIKIMLLLEQSEHLLQLGYSKENILRLMSGNYLKKSLPILINHTKSLLEQGLLHQDLVQLSQSLNGLNLMLKRVRNVDGKLIGSKRKRIESDSELLSLGFSEDFVEFIASKDSSQEIFNTLKICTPILLSKGFMLSQISMYANVSHGNLCLNHMVSLFELEKASDIDKALLDNCIIHAQGYEFILQIKSLLQKLDGKEVELFIGLINAFAKYHDSIRCVRALFNLYEHGFSLDYLASLSKNRTLTLLMQKLNEDLYALEQMLFSKKEIVHYYTSSKQAKLLSKHLNCFNKLRLFKGSEPIFAKLKSLNQADLMILKSFLDTLSYRATLNLKDCLEKEKNNPSSTFNESTICRLESILSVIQPSPSVPALREVSMFVGNKEDESFWDSFELFEGLFDMGEKF